jgi:protein gp37
VSDKSAIEWTDATWNPTTGCTRVSAGCDHCYIDRTPPFRIGHRQFDKPGIGGTTGVMLHPERLDQPLRWKRPRRIFVNSLSDLFHDEIPADFIADVFAVMREASQHIFQVLTKRPRRMHNLLTHWATEGGYTDLPLPNVWLGTSVEDQKAADLRIPVLMQTPAAVRFLSAEPLLGPIDLGPFMNDDFMGGDIEDFIHWIIVGGESGPHARPMHPDWARHLRNQCVSHGIAYFFKQWGEWTPAPEDKPYLRRETDSILCDNGYIYPLTQPHDVPGENGKVIRKVGKKHAGRELDGRTWDEMPEAVPA